MYLPSQFLKTTIEILEEAKNVTFEQHDYKP